MAKDSSISKSLSPAPPPFRPVVLRVRQFKFLGNI